MGFRKWLETVIRVIDLRDPNVDSEDSWSTSHRRDKRLSTSVVLGSDATLLYRWGSTGNILPWEEVLKKVGEVERTSPFCRTVNCIQITPEGNALLDRSVDYTKWPGVRNRYTDEVPRIVRELLDRNLIRPGAKVYSGNWASRRGELLGVAEEIVARTEIPDRLTLYHGTNDIRWEVIQKEGLRPVTADQRQWKGRAWAKGQPAHRGEAVYLTASPTQAVTYARKAVFVARRAGHRGSQPVILKVTITSKDYGKMKPDDDYLAKHGGKPPSLFIRSEWWDSLSYFGQVALVGTVPPDQIELYGTWKGTNIWGAGDEDVP